MTELTAEEALNFSIAKWEAIVENDGYSLSIDQAKELGIWDLIASCGLCEKYMYDIPESPCTTCPFFTKENKSCSNSSHIWYQWHMNTTKENAQAVLDALKQLK